MCCRCAVFLTYTQLRWLYKIFLFPFISTLSLGKNSFNTIYITKNSFPETATGYTKGTTPKGEDTAANTSTGNYTVIFDNNLTNINYKEPYNYDKDIEVPTIIIPAKSYAAYDIE